MTRARAPLAALALSALALAAVGVAARASERARAAEQPAIDVVAARLPSSDLALAGGGRHLRFPSLEEPGAAFADAPASPDVDPGGGAIAPPRELYVRTALPPKRVSR
jgi:hypothetical protein